MLVIAAGASVTLETVSGFFYARASLYDRLPFRQHVRSPEMTLLSKATETAAVFFTAHC
jgi:hypothetical protein